MKNSDVPSSFAPRAVPLPPEPYRYAAEPASAGAARPRWSAGRTAAVAGVTIVLVSAGAIGAAAALPLGSGDSAGSSQGFPGGGQFQRFRGGFGQNGTAQQNGLGQQNRLSQLNGAQLPLLPGPAPRQ